MKYSHLVLTVLVFGVLPTLLAAQVEPLPLPGSPADTLPPGYRATTPPPGQSTEPANQVRGPYFFASAQKHPFTPHDVAMRDAVQSLGFGKHRFVLCELKDGSSFVGGIGLIEQSYFRISQGIFSGREIRYSELREVPQPVPATREHFVNGLEWTGFITFCVVLSPVALALMPFMFAGLLND